MFRLDKRIGLAALAGLIAWTLAVPAAYAQRVQSAGTMVGPGTSSGFFPFFRVVPQPAVLQQAANIAALGRAYAQVPPYSPLVNNGRGFNPFPPGGVVPSAYSPYLTSGYNPYLAANPYALSPATLTPLSTLPTIPVYNTWPLSTSSLYANPSLYGQLNAQTAGGASYSNLAQSPYGDVQATMSTASAASLATSATLDNILAASGLPSEHGRLQWPVGLRSLGASEADGLRQRIDAILQLTAPQAADHRVNADLLQEMTRSVNRLRLLLLEDKEDRFGLPLAVYDEAEQFLNRLRKVPKILQAASKPPEKAADGTSR